jgi:hypothetical protein
MKWYATYRLWIIFILLFALMVLLTPPHPDTLTRYNINPATYRILLFTTEGIPAFITWFAAFYGYERLRDYNSIIKKSKEADAFSYLEKGSRWTALYLPVVTLASLTLIGISNAHPGFRGMALVLSGYIGVVLSVVAFSLIGTGTRMMAANVNVRPSLVRTRILLGTFIVGCVLYSYYIIEHGHKKPNPYHQPIILMLLTVVAPLFFAWLMGLLAILDIGAYAQKVPGILYRKALRLLSGGLLIIIISSILLQLIHSANTERGRLYFGNVLLAHYALYLTISLGFILIGVSAKKLQQIEKI